MTAILHRVKEMVLMFAKQNKTKKRKKKTIKLCPSLRDSHERKKNQSAVFRTGKGQTELPASSKVNFSPKLGFNGC